MFSLSRVEIRLVGFVDRRDISLRIARVSGKGFQNGSRFESTVVDKKMGIMTFFSTSGDKVSILASENKAKVEKPVEDKPFIFLDVGVLREYLAIELDLRLPTIPFDLERAIDDWVFLIFFVGNDFLPHLPSLEIREGAIDTLLKIWKTEFERMGGYLTNHGKVELARAQIILEGLAKSEDEIFQRRKEGEWSSSWLSAASGRLNLNSRCSRGTSRPQ